MFCFVLGLRLYAIVATARKNTAAGLPKKINLPTNRGTSEGPETSVLELSTRRIQPRCAYFCKSIMEDVPKHKSVESDDTKKAHLNWMRLFESFPTVVSECP